MDFMYLMFLFIGIIDDFDNDVILCFVMVFVESFINCSFCMIIVVSYDILVDFKD